MYASVIVEISNKSVDRSFTYGIPSFMRDKIKIGARVKVRFGHQLLEGFVTNIFDSVDCDYEVRDIEELVDLEPILNEEMLELGRKISDITLCSLISAYQVMLPKALKASYNTNINVKRDRYVVLDCDIDRVNSYIEKCRYSGQIDILNNIIINNEVKIDRVNSAINTLVKKGLIKIVFRDSYRYKYSFDREDVRLELNDEQRVAVDKVCSSFNRDNTFLLYGVTGAGKTLVYMDIIDCAVSNGKSAIMLVPEISLTPQIVDRFMARFGDNVAILHSGLSDGERYDEYRKIVNGDVSIVIGARSAIFAPLSDIGVIIIDEEHSSTYKQDNNPRYHAREVAIMRSKYHSCPLVLGSATPSLESMARALNKVYKLIVLKKRASGGSLPVVSVVDMKDEIKKGNYIFSSLLDSKIREKLNNGEQIILFLNRRGYSSVITCNSCGSVYKCPNCDISLTYHKSSGMLRCHYCGYAISRYDVCPNCNSKDLKDYGLGTEQLEEYIVKNYNARVVRMDMDTTSRKGAHEKIIKDFGEHKYDILLGTQMVSKGLDFPLVTLVGVINADASLNIPDFRSSERTFQLLCQVSGRAGRSSLVGEVVIQTYNNKHYSIMYACNHDYLSFYREEMKLRKQLNYSPYYYIILVNISSSDYGYSFEEAKKIGEYLRRNLSKDTFVLGPTMANVFKVNKIYHQQCIIKYRYDDRLRDTLVNLNNYYKSNNKIKVEIDIDPNKC